MVSGLPSREKILTEHKWRVSDIFETDELWEDEFKRIKLELPELSDYAGTLNQSSDYLLTFIKNMHSTEVALGKLYLYAHLKNDQDKSVPRYQEMYDRCRALFVEYQQTVSFFEPELLKINENDLHTFLKENIELTLYQHYIDDILRKKAHTLSASEERLIAMSGEVMSAPAEIFSIWESADIVFPDIKDENGNFVKMSEGLYGRYQQSPNRTLRKDSYLSLYKPFIEHRNYLAVNFSTIIKSHIFNARARNYSSTVEAALDSNAIPVSIYKNLIKNAKANLGPLQRYNRLRKQILELKDGVHDYDLRAPLFTSKEKQFTWEDAKRIVYDGVQPLGTDYQEKLERSFRTNWIDVYENKGKRTGAYSSGTYGVHPYVLMNFNGSMSDVFTLAHEMGHALHTFYTIKAQPYVYGDYPIFLAEVASTSNEGLLQNYLIQNAGSKEEKLSYINAYLDRFSQTLYRQIIFAEFELVTHEMVEKGEALTAEKLDNLFAELYQSYHGPEFVMDRETKALWSRVPHFYYNYYVFQYATSFVASAALVAKIFKDGDPARERFIDFLKSGRSKYAIETLKDAGIDMNSEEPLLLTIKWMDQLLDEMEALI
ncbi:MAG: oligoendopeptidase F [Calditrichaceae bacterium]